MISPLSGPDSFLEVVFFSAESYGAQARRGEQWISVPGSRGLLDTSLSTVSGTWGLQLGLVWHVPTSKKTCPKER